MRCDSSGPMPAIGSSSSSRRGRVASAMRDLELALLAVRQASAASTSAALGEPDLGEHVARRLDAARASVARRAPEAEAVAGMRLHRERHVVERGEVAEDAGDLERARQAPARALVRGQRA